VGWRQVVLDAGLGGHKKKKNSSTLTGNFRRNQLSRVDEKVSESVDEPENVGKREMKICKGG